MNRLFIFVFLIPLWFSFCKNAVSSTADQPNKSYELLFLLNQKFIDSFYWEGLMDISACTTTPENLLGCNLYRENYKNFLRSRTKNLFVYADTIQKTGNLQFEIAHPQKLDFIKYEIPVSVDVEIGPETGSGVARILVLKNTNPISQDGISLILNEFRADVLEDGLRGSLKVNLKDQENLNLNLTFSFNIKKRL
ncbi:MAG: hypothetical protein NZ853_00745 [Leptospiraceae bacterium]|nr:hypothetical protein [Leptospiraceae bacterium]MDW7976244.1 hypothetical protein [Leptospiraceae bacterium]